MATPTSQKAGERPISFTLQDLGNGNDITNVSLVIRPEELTRVEPSRLNTQQTLGGAWADNFGVGIRQVNISGHTGWRGSPTQDGMALFRQLNDAVFNQWHAKRAQAIANGRDPSDIQLIFADMLDDFVYVVAPQTFTLRRNKARPLLMQYQIAMTVLSENLALDGESEPGRLDGLAAVKILREVLGKIRDFATTVPDFIDGTLGTLVRDFMELTAEVLDLVTETVDSLKGSLDLVVNSLISVAADLAQAGRNIAATVAAVASLPNYVRNRLMGVGAAFSYARCLLENAFGGYDLYPDYSDWFGASNCSALSGGRPMSPLRHENPFERLNATRPMPVALTTEASGALTALAAADIQRPGAMDNMAAQIGDVNRGTSVRRDAA